MKQLFALILAGIVLAQSPAAFALDAKKVDPYRYVDQEAALTEHRWGVGANVSYASPMEDNADSTAYVGAVVLYGIRDNIDVQMDLGYLSFAQEAFGLDFGDLEGVPMIFSARVYNRFLMGQMDSELYFLGGVGMIFWSFDEAGSLSGANNSVSPDDSLAWRVGLGWDLFVVKNLSLNLEWSYTFSEEDLDLTNPGTTQIESVDTDFWQLGGGVKYVFD